MTTWRMLVGGAMTVAVFAAGLGACGTDHACPGEAPEVGDGCAISYACEYGTDPSVRCNTVFACKDGRWLHETSPASTNCSTTNTAADCPASFGVYAAAALQNVRCQTLGSACVYPEGRLNCATVCDHYGLADSSPFFCPESSPSSSVDCPSIRPRFGAACSREGADCDYGGCAGNVVLRCSSGVWQQVTAFACPA